MIHLPNLCLRASLAALFFCFVGPRTHSGQTAVVHDAVGDTEFGAPPFLDITHTKVTLQRGNGHFVFMAVVAAPIPPVPSLPYAAISWRVATQDLAIDPIGTFVVRAYWNANAGKWVADLVDRRPVQLGGRPVIVTQLPFQVSGSTLKVAVDGAWFEYPESFLFRVASRVADFPAPGISDIAPENDGFTGWPGGR